VERAVASRTDGRRNKGRGRREIRERKGGGKGGGYLSRGQLEACAALFRHVKGGGVGGEGGHVWMDVRL
jgi:hypothetical protein